MNDKIKTINDKIEEINKKIKNLEIQLLINIWIVCLLSVTICLVTLF